MALVAKYTEQVSLVISKELRAQIDQEAEHRQVSIGTVVREALERHYTLANLERNPNFQAAKLEAEALGVGAGRRRPQPSDL